MRTPDCRWTNFLVALLALQAITQARAQTPNTWTGAASDLNWNTGGNWSVGLPPDVAFGEVGVIANGNTVFLNAAASTNAGGLTLTNGGLEIRPGGSINFSAGGGATGTVAVNGTSTLRIKGAGQTFNAAGNVSFAATATYIPEITSAAHTPISTTASLLPAAGSKVRPIFTGYTPTSTDSWILGDASAITGSFTIDKSLAGLALGQDLKTTVVAGGTNGQQLVLSMRNILVLNLNADTGAVSISSPSGGSITMTGYGLASTTGQLNPTGWSSLADQAVSSFSEVGTTGVNRLEELAGPINSTTQGSTTINATPQGLGSPFSIQPFTVVPNVTFEYVTDADELVTGIVNPTGLNAVNNLLLTVDPATGVGQLKNSSLWTIKLQGYTVASPSGSLKPGNGDWLSLSDQSVTGVDEANATTNNLSELVPLVANTLTLAPGQSYTMGDLFKTVGEAGTQDLALQYLLLTTVNGDYNNNGTVDGADYVMWRKNLGANMTLPGEAATPGQVTVEDYAVWRSNFGTTASSSSTVFSGVVKYESIAGAGAGFAAVQVPEPGTASLAMLLICGLAATRSYRSIGLLASNTHC